MLRWMVLPGIVGCFPGFFPSLHSTVYRYKKKKLSTRSDNRPDPYFEYIILRAHLCLWIYYDCGCLCVCLEFLVNSASSTTRKRPTSHAHQFIANDPPMIGLIKNLFYFCFIYCQISKSHYQIP